MLEKLASRAGSGAGMPANTAGLRTGIGWLGVTAGILGVTAGRLGVNIGITGLALAITGDVITLGVRAGMLGGVTPETLTAARLAARAAGSGAGMPAITDGSSTLVVSAGGTGGELAITWVGVSVRAEAGVRVAGTAAGDCSVPNMGTSGLRGSLLAAAAAGTADITVGTAVARGVAAAGAALLTDAVSPAGVTIGGG